MARSGKAGEGRRRRPSWRRLGTKARAEKASDEGLAEVGR